ncbi:MAG: N-acetyl-gamma-glutamyl-phosphate reductase [Candidatus Omnitrophica bacterium]|nr:N-acetyl-gamma-glutamyl-phosphate reductase [Candidatus Omnitrophota bacterium]
MINVGIVGVTGFAGEELLDILLRHPEVRISYLSAKIDKPTPISQIFPRLKGKIDLVCKKPEIKEIVNQCDLVFLALPHTVSMEFVPALLRAKKRVIDLSADYRLKDTKVYAQFYKVNHKDKLHLNEAVYGLPEIYRHRIKQARLIANPGCYPTVIILSLAPLVALEVIDPASIIIDAKSGVSGAGRRLAESFLFTEINEDFKAYKVGVHQHTPEIEQELSRLGGKKIKVTFVPHLLPLTRGILATIYARKDKKLKNKSQNLINLYRRFYKKEPFIRIRQEDISPRLRDVVGTNFCDISIKDNPDTVIVIATIDNLLKGASGQAVQNFNIMYGFREDTALV